MPILIQKKSSAHLSRQITKARGQPLLHRGGIGIVVGEGVRVDVDGIGVNGHARRLYERDAILHCAVDRGGLSEEGLGVACVHVRRIGGLDVDLSRGGLCAASRSRHPCHCVSRLRA